MRMTGGNGFRHSPYMHSMTFNAGIDELLHLYGTGERVRDVFMNAIDADSLPAYGANAPPDHRGCFHCGKPGHWKPQCPNIREAQTAAGRAFLSAYSIGRKGGRKDKAPFGNGLPNPNHRALPSMPALPTMPATGLRLEPGRSRLFKLRPH